MVEEEAGNWLAADQAYERSLANRQNQTVENRREILRRTVLVPSPAMESMHGPFAAIKAACAAEENDLRKLNEDDSGVAKGFKFYCPVGRKSIVSGENLPFAEAALYRSTIKPIGEYSRAGVAFTLAVRTASGWYTTMLLAPSRSAETC